MYLFKEKNFAASSSALGIGAEPCATDLNYSDLMG